MDTCAHQGSADGICGGIHAQRTARYASNCSVMVHNSMTTRTCETHNHWCAPTSSQRAARSYSAQSCSASTLLEARAVAILIPLCLWPATALNVAPCSTQSHRATAADLTVAAAAYSRPPREQEQRATIAHKPHCIHHISNKKVTQHCAFLPKHAQLPAFWSCCLISNTPHTFSLLASTCHHERHHADTHFVIGCAEP